MQSPKLYIAPGYPPIAPHVFISIDDIATFGDPQQVIFSDLGLSAPDFAFNADILQSQGWQTIETPIGVLITAIVTKVSEGSRMQDYGAGDIVSSNLTDALQNIEAAPAFWSPMMGTNHAGLSLGESAHAMLGPIGEYFPRGSTLILAPPDTDDMEIVQEIEELSRKFVEGFDVSVVEAGGMIEGFEYLTSSNVLQAQRTLRKAGVFSGFEDGELGPQTLSAIAGTPRSEGETLEDALAALIPDEPPHVARLLAAAALEADATPATSREEIGDFYEDQWIKPIQDILGPYATPTDYTEMLSGHPQVGGEPLTAERRAEIIKRSHEPPEDEDSGGLHTQTDKPASEHDATPEASDEDSITSMSDEELEASIAFNSSLSDAPGKVDADLDLGDGVRDLEALKRERERRKSASSDIENLSSRDLHERLEAMGFGVNDREWIEDTDAEAKAMVDLLAKRGEAALATDDYVGWAESLGPVRWEDGPGEGLAMLRQSYDAEREKYLARNAPPDEAAPFQSDRPARKAEEDMLNRKGVADALGTIIDRVWTKELAHLKEGEDRSFVIHLHGPWGSGKSSILGFLEEVLLSGEIAKPKLAKDVLDPPWIVANFNAWRAQRRGPAWWSLMDRVYDEIEGQLGEKDRLAAWKVRWSHRLWRFQSGWLPTAIQSAVAVIAIGLVVFAASNSSGQEIDWKTIGAAVGAIITLITTVLALKGDVGLVNVSAAQRYRELARNPEHSMSRRFAKMVEEAGRPVAVFIDDLDRCEPEYVVELLQTIQTLYRNARVIYVAAGDKDWICRSFELAYDKFAEPVAEPGHTLGHMFLEKIFQLSVEVPPLTAEQRDAYWKRLLERSPAKEQNLKEVEEEVKTALDNADTEAKVLRVSRTMVARSPEAASIVKSAAMKRLHADDIRKEQEHFLLQFAQHLEPNPRAMKRLLNAYGFRRGFDVVGVTDRDALARWTILEMRWPLLAEHLRTGGVDEPSEDVSTLLGDPEVRDLAGKLRWDQLPQVAPRGETGLTLISETEVTGSSRIG